MGRTAAFVVLCVVIVSVPLFAEDHESEDPLTLSQHDVERFRAFAKMYGYVRFFHPSDEAASIDWDRFAVLGVIRIREAGASGDLLGAMNRLFTPIAPTVQIYRTGSEPEPIAPPDATAGLKPVAWQHVGVRLPGPPSIYLSKRTDREVRFSAGGVFGTVTQTTDATPFRGKAVRLKASIRAEVEGEGNQGQMWFSVVRASGEQGFFDNMQDRPITSNRWGEYEIVGKIAEDADRLAFGCFLLGRGGVWFDDVRLAVDDGEGGWSPVEIRNPRFEDGEEGRKPDGWYAETPGYLFETTGIKPSEGERSVMITHQPDEVLSDDLFDARPAIGDVIDVELGAGLSARIPLTVWSDQSVTIPAGDEKALKWMGTELDSVNIAWLSEYSECTRLAGIVIAWNVLQHFYPNFDVVDTDWDAALTEAFAAALPDESHEEYFGVLERLAVALNDGRTRVYHPSYAPYGYLPLVVDWVEDRVVVTASAIDELRPGDVVSSVDGVDARESLLGWEARMSGSPQRKRVWPLRLFGAGELGETAKLAVIRDEAAFEVDVTRGAWKGRPSESRPDAVSKVGEGIFYVDLTRAAASDIESRMSEIAAALGVVFDLRGSLRTDHRIMGHMLTEADVKTAWMQVPEIIRPDREGPIGWRDIGWSVEPASPRIEGKVAFLVDGRTIGAAESVVDLVDVHDLAEIVGQPTAGAAGEVNNMTLPGKFEFRWSGARIIGRDGSDRTMVGVQPSIPAKRTIQGIRDGRDELLDRAVRVVSTDDAGEK